MSESNRVILLRYFKDNNELDVFMNGKYLCTFEHGNMVAYSLVELLEKLGYSTIEKQTYAERWYSLES